MTFVGCDLSHRMWLIGHRLKIEEGFISDHMVIKVVSGGLILPVTMQAALSWESASFSVGLLTHDLPHSEHDGGRGASGF